MPKKISLKDIKEALKDSRFRDSLPISYQDDIVQYLHNPGCACNIPLYRKILKNCKEQINKYFPNCEIEDEDMLIEKMAENNWTVINCEANELEDKLKQLPPGRKQLAVARYENKITLIVNELDVIF